jgi:hypothetical protein
MMDSAFLTTQIYTEKKTELKFKGKTHMERLRTRWFREVMENIKKRRER